MPAAVHDRYRKCVEHARAAGLIVVRSEIAKDGTIVLYHAETESPQSALDAWRAKREGQHEGD